MEWIAKHWLSGKTVKVTVKDGKVASLIEINQETNQWIAPGLIDVQVNGIGGFDLNGEDLTTQTIRRVVSVLHQGGVTRFCPTVVTGPGERMLHCIRTIAQTCEEDPLVNHAVLGIHVEGPFISSEDGPRGAHCKEWVRDPDWEEFLHWHQVAGGRIRKVTLAPERPGALAFIKKLRKMGVIAAIGHTAAEESCIIQAVEAGASMSTHLGNGAHPYIKRHPNYIWAQLAEDRLWAGFIADGHHLPTSTLKVMIRAKGSKAILTSDAVNLAGLAPGEYVTALHPHVILEPNGLLHLAESPDILAGSATPLYKGIENVVKWGLCSIGEAIQMATLHPAQLFRLAGQETGLLEVGSFADFFLFTWADNQTLLVRETVSLGTSVFHYADLG
ncbi:N-acetylglucosamine-6-phosphate deacetylase [Aneurinibacillus tyrosinisolvens]|uniref:N-acetylglucosamine-6-phosphate deacetylase n=1 Tax=Aneurinibacillus tyrosinisolvens TaxID=1443435 RepID=UPI00063F6C8F|nr:amidohydrolase family protein [Aneurinibacillus tyrosinisolvens]